MDTDFIVIGSGLAGLTSSLILSEYGKVLLVTKGKISDGATSLAQGGIAAVVLPEDSFQNHIQDTLMAGAFHNNKKAVEYLVRQGPAAIDWLEQQGVRFAKKDGQFSPTREAAHSHRRVLHATDFTGREIEKALIKKVRQAKNIEVWEKTFVIDLIVEKGKCLGVKILQEKKEDFFLQKIYGRAVILATGGLGQVYRWTTNPKVATGDGVAMAVRAGAKVKDLEFIQFHPTALKESRSPLFLLSEALRGEGAYLVKVKSQQSQVKKKKKFKIETGEERFMKDYDSRMELAPRDIVARAIFAEQKKGYEVFLDIRHRGRDFLVKRFPNIYRELKKRGYDLVKDLIPVTPAAHYSCGGVKTDIYGRTNIKNFFAFGEVACTGVHGANRLASNSLLEAVVFPKILGKLIPTMSSIIRIIEPKEERGFGSDEIYIEDFKDFRKIKKIRQKLQKLMWEKVGISRRRKELSEALSQLREWEKELDAIKSLKKEVLELKNMILVGKLIVQAALKRKKSLGGHFVV